MEHDNFFTVIYTPLYIYPTFLSNKHCDIPKGYVVRKINDVDGWCQVEYQTSKKLFIGYLPTEYIEPFFQSNIEENVIKTKSATLDPNDACQYIVYKNNIQYNLCGEFSVLYCAGWKTLDIEDWLNEWAVKSPSVFNRIFSGGRSRTTGISDLTNMFQTFDGYPEKFETIYEKFLFRGKLLFTPKRVRDILEIGHVLVGCKINRTFGRLESSGIPHWVVLKSIVTEGRGGLVNLYNPFSNSIETYTWDELYASIGGSNPYGIVVPK